MTYTDFKNKYNGKGIDFDGYYGFQCMDLAHQYATEVVGKDFAPAPAAKDVWNQNIDGYDKIPNTPDGVPQQGDIVIWGTGVGAYGHIAVFDHGDANSFVSFDQNWPLGSLCHLQNHNYNGVLGWFHPKTSVNIDYEKLFNECRVDRDSHWDQLQELDKENVDLRTELEGKNNEIDALRNDLKAKDDQIASLQQRLIECENKAPQVVEKIVIEEKLVPSKDFSKLGFFDKVRLLFS